MIAILTAFQTAHPQLWLWYYAFVGICALTVLLALMRNINQQKSDVLPAPRCDLIARGGHDAWEVSEARER
jgi:uncharacterized membrane protein YuzA (DUF378 family)